MGTSNWQNISYCMEKIVEIQPQSILDVGIGFGRWAILSREFLEIWNDRMTPDQWQVKIDGIEAFSPQLQEYHSYFYNKIYVGDAFDLLPNIFDYDLIILGDVLEHFTPEKAAFILDICIRKSKYVMLNIPLGSCWLQGEKYNNPFEAHLSAWEDENLSFNNLKEKRLFKDFQNREFGVYIYRGGVENIQTLKSHVVSTKIENSAVDELCAYFHRHPKRAQFLFRIIDFLRG
jgi:SAM-dependent methyltransferase